MEKAKHELHSKRKMDMGKERQINREGDTNKEGRKEKAGGGCSRALRGLKNKGENNKIENKSKKESITNDMPFNKTRKQKLNAKKSRSDSNTLTLIRLSQVNAM